MQKKRVKFYEGLDRRVTKLYISDLEFESAGEFIRDFKILKSPERNGLLEHIYYCFSVRTSSFQVFFAYLLDTLFDYILNEIV